MSLRIAIAGGGGFAYILAREIAQTGNALLVLSTRQHPEFEELGIQVAVVDYTNVEALQYTLKGVDLLISTIHTATIQINLIDAARHARVHTFVPAEFKGAVAHRPTAPTIPRDQDSSIVQHHLAASSHPMQYTIFSVGVLYERFLPGGIGRLNIGRSMSLWNAGDYLLNIETAMAEIVNTTADGRPVVVSMTSVNDVARFVAAAVEIGLNRWPREFRMRGDQLSVEQVVSACSTGKNVPFTVGHHEYAEIQGLLEWAWTAENWPRWLYYQQLQASADGRYDFESANLNELLDQVDGIDVRPELFRDWIFRVCVEAQIRAA